MSESDKVYTNAEEMPHLPGAAGLAPVVEAVQCRLVVSPRTEEGRIFVKLTVGEAGDVQDVHLLKGLSTAVDSTVLGAVRRLPPSLAGKICGP